MEPPFLITPPADSPVQLSDVARRLRILHDDDDTDIFALIDAATAHLDGWSGILGRCLITQVWGQRLAAFSTEIRLPFPDVSNVVITYIDAAGSTQTVSADTYHLTSDARGGKVVLAAGKSWPATAERPDAVTITMTVGYGGETDVPMTLRHAIKEMAAAMHENTFDNLTASAAFDRWTSPHRMRSP